MKIHPKGILPAMITPLTEEEKVNKKSLRRLINYLIDGGVHGIYAIGTTGEFYALSNDEYRDILEITIDEVAGRIPVYAGVNKITTRESIKLAEIAEATGVDALSVLTPMFISPNQQQLYEYFSDVANSTSLPIILYDNCPKTNVHIKPETVAKLADIKNIIGIKDSTGDLTVTEEYIRLTSDKDFNVFIGRDTMILAALVYGAVGAVAATANIAPKICTDIYNYYINNDIENAREAQFKLASLRIAFSLGTFPAVIKEGLNMLGLDAGVCYKPVKPLTSEERTKLKTILTDMGILA